MNGEEYVDAADRARRETYDAPMGLAEYVDAVLERPSIAAHAAKYVLDAVEAAGTRTVLEAGEERERYRFFDDPHNDGEHAVLGNTETLNAFVDDLRAIAAGRGKGEKIVWLTGPTATGKSEFKRCLINGLREHSKTPEGRRYTVEWNVESAGDPGGLSYGDAPASDDEHWYPSPVQAQPLSVFPEAVREDVIAAANDRLDDEIGVRAEADLGPFSREALEYLEEHYRRRGHGEPFSAAVSPDHLRVKNYVVDVGRGIGVLQAEDSGTPKERLVGSWMPEVLRELDSRGRKNPQAFSYDGVLSQGNGGLTVVEDAAGHADLLRKLLSIPEEGSVKLDKGIGMDVDTQLLIISNPDLEAQLNQHADRGGQDPLKALKRRLDKHEFGYLTDLSLEVQLLRRELAGETDVWEADSYDDLDARIRAPLTMRVREGGSVREVEFAPHAIEAAALYAVVTRLDVEGLPDGIDLIDKALLFDRGYVRRGEERVDADDVPVGGETDGEHGIPVTYTRDTLADLLAGEPDRSHPDLAVEDVITPRDVLDAMADGLHDAPVFAPSESGEYENRVVPVKDYVFGRQEEDVLDAMLADHRADEEAVGEYVAHVYAWATEEPVVNDRGEEVPPDPLRMKVFEIEQLGRFGEDDYEGTDPTGPVESFRREEIIMAINRHAWENRGEGFDLDDVDLDAIPGVRDVLASNDWADVRRVFEDFDPRQWDDPPEGTQTARVKEATLDRLAERGYSRASAELAGRHVTEQVSHRWG